MGTVYSTPQAARLLGISEGSIRNYVRHELYAAYFTAGANPPKGIQRELTDHDLTLLAYIRERTAARVRHEEIAEQIAAGVLEERTWTPPAPDQEDLVDESATTPPDVEGWGVPRRKPAPESSSAPPPAPLALLASSLVEELARAREREEQSRQREQELWNRVVELESAKSRAEGELSELRAAHQRRGFLARLFGG